MTTMSTLIAEHYVSMRRYASALTRDETTNEDVLHSACVSALGANIEADDIRNPGAWLSLCVLNAFRRHVRSNVVPARKAVEFVPEEHADGCSGGQEAAIDVRRAMSAIRRLAPSPRRIMLMSAAGYPQHEICERLGISAQAVSQSLRRSRQAISKPPRRGPWRNRE